MNNWEKKHFKKAFGIDYPVDGMMYWVPTFDLMERKVCIVLSPHRTLPYEDPVYFMSCNDRGNLVVGHWDILMDGQVQVEDFRHLVPV